MITWDEIMAIEARANAATPGPWDWTEERSLISQARPQKPIGEIPGFGVAATGQDIKNARFIAHARQDVSTLCGAVRQLKTELQHLKDDYQAGLAEIERLDERYDVLANAFNGLATDTTLQAEVDRLQEALGDMLHIFDRELDKGTVGRKTCDKARAALAKTEV